MEDSGRGWKVGFFILVVLLIASLIWGFAMQHSLNARLSTANASLAQYTSTNAQSQQQCIGSAQSVADAAPTLSSTGPNLSAAISACKSN